MITLYGFALSNYYNKTKLALLEKDIDFREELVRPSQDDATLKRSPLGKIPFIETAEGFLSESQAILEYLEDTYPEKPLYPRSAYQRAKCREFIQHLELNVELIARRLYKEAIFGGKVSAETKEEVLERLEPSLKGLARLVNFSPYILGTHFSAADVVAWTSFFVISFATKSIYGKDLVAEHIPGLSEYLKIMEERACVRKVAQGRDEALKIFFANK